MSSQGFGSAGSPNSARLSAGGQRRNQAEVQELTRVQAVKDVCLPSRPASSSCRLVPRGTASCLVN
jgi:hypothetical protein